MKSFDMKFKDSLWRSRTSGNLSHNAFAFYLDSISLRIGALLCSWCNNWYVLANNSVNNVSDSVTLWFFCLQRSCKNSTGSNAIVKRSVLSVFVNLHDAECVC